MMLCALIYIFLIYFTNLAFCNIQCKDENNQNVDWFIMYKLPKQTQHENELIKVGLAYAFITPQNIGNGWTTSAVSINSSQSMLGYTLKPLYENDINLEFIYNDQPPSGTAGDEYGHSKGILLADRNTGIWLIHSVPHFPQVQDSLYSYPKTATHFGQSVLCVTLNLNTFETVANQLLYIHPYSYKKNLPEFVEPNKYPSLKSLFRGDQIMKAPFWSKNEIQSLSKVNFQSYAKSSKFNKDLYVDWLAQDLRDDLEVETWPNGPGRLRSNCSLQYRVNNISSVKINSTNLVFSDHVDHSKWAITAQKTWICIGGVNRAEHQEHRGGGTLCLNSSKIWLSYKMSVQEIEDCP
ncbi:LOW QUALITY PROTEIN: deoxyribonuclease-2-alpha [Ctenocephalides felis]|uniref:LOW QUALITY PROTEIN: deoxyribonuclease-2-alpha n=1 Tax=Ctenocephalides felis TaxID=7515 RepID=UPI000E6E482E|nr:LOW QUALITY PROTEIN: deoxyribonuclease-2-alpha [Ctenocephalides felis]